MKCDVCGHKIPIGAHECSNCGYKFGKQYANRYNATSQTHNHIQVEKKKSNRKIEVNNYHVPQTSVWVAIVIAVVLVGFVAYLTIPTVLNSNENMTQSNMTFQDAIDRGFDDGTLALAQNEEERLMNFFQETLKVEDVRMNEYFEKTNGEIYATIEAACYEDEESYSILITYDNQECIEKSMSIGKTIKESIQTSETIDVSKNRLEHIGNYIDVDDIYERLDKYRHMMVVSQDDPRTNIYNDYGTNVTVYLSDTFFNDEYHYFYTIGNKQ